VTRVAGPSVRWPAPQSSPAAHSRSHLAGPARFTHARRARALTTDDLHDCRRAAGHRADGSSKVAFDAVGGGRYPLPRDGWRCLGVAGIQSLATAGAAWGWMVTRSSRRSLLSPPEVKGGVPMGTFGGLPPEVLETLVSIPKATKTSSTSRPGRMSCRTGSPSSRRRRGWPVPAVTGQADQRRWQRDRTRPNPSSSRACAIRRTGRSLSGAPCNAGSTANRLSATARHTDRRGGRLARGDQHLAARIAHRGANGASAPECATLSLGGDEHSHDHETGARRPYSVPPAPLRVKLALRP
jgi:hypothetical protein